MVTPRSEQIDSALVLLDVASSDRNDCVHLLRQFGDAPLALINAQPHQQRRLAQTHPWSRGVCHRAPPRPLFVRGFQTRPAGGDWIPCAMSETLTLHYLPPNNEQHVMKETTI